MSQKTNKKDGRTIVFIGGFPPSIARLAEYNYELIKELVRQGGMKIIVLANKMDIYYQKRKPSEFIDENISVKKVWNGILSLIIIPYLFYLRRRAGTVVISIYHGIFGKSGIINMLSTFLLFLALRLMSFRIITILHTLPEFRKSLSKSTLYYLGFRMFTIIIVKMSSKVVVLVRLYAKLLRNTYKFNEKNKVFFIPHGIPVYKLCASNRDTIAAKREVRLGFIGLISPRKNIEMLLRAAQLLKNELPEKKFTIELIGAVHPYYVKESVDLLRHALEKYSEITVRYHGYMETDKLQEYVCKNIDVVVFPYNNSTGTSGIVNMIAPAAKPVVLPKFYEFYELLEDGFGVVLFKPGSVMSLKEEIKRIIKENSFKEYEQRMLRATKIFSISNIVKKFISEVLSDAK